MVRRVVLAAFVLASAVAVVPSATALTTEPEPCTDAADTATLEGVIRVAKPAATPTAVVAFFHGYGHQTASWEHHMRWAAGALGVLAIAAEYDGWSVQQGADRTLAALPTYLHCSDHVIAYGVSMGANASGLAVAADGVFDEWIAVEGVHNITETYLEARALESRSAYAAKAVADIEAETGGPIEDVPDAYTQRTNVLRAAEIADHVDSVVLVHGVLDGLAPSNQSREMQAALRARGTPVDHYSVVLQHNGDSGTVPESHITALGENGYKSPFAGHGTESKEHHRVLCEGFMRLAEVVHGASAENREVLVDAQSSTCNPNRST